MKVTIFKQVGKEKIMIEGEGESLKKALYDVAINASFPNVYKCDICGSDNLTIRARKAKGKHQYVFIKCMSCSAELNFGEREEDAVTYLRTNEDKQLAWKKLES